MIKDPFKPFIFLLLAISQNLFPQQFRFHNFSTGDGLPQAYIYTLCQDSCGNLWIGTGDGLVKYNGFNLESFTVDDNLASNFITCSLRNGNELWFGHENGKISLSDGSNFNEIPFADSIADRVTSLTLSPSGKVWAATFSSGLYRLNRETMLFELMTNTDAYINTIIHVSENELVAGTNAGLLKYELDDRDEIVNFTEIKGVPQSKITSVISYKDDLIAATENEGLYILGTEGRSSSGKLVDGSENITGVQNACSDAKGGVWLATYGNGLVRMKPDHSGFDYFNISNGFTADNVKTVFEDREGNIWSGNFGEGLTLLTPEPFSFFCPDNEKYGASVFSVISDDDVLWLGTSKGLLKTDASGNIVDFYSLAKGLPPDTITSLYKRKSSDLWIGTSRNGAFRMNTLSGHIEPVMLNEGILEKSITIITGNGDDVSIGTRKGLTIINESGKMTTYSISNGLPNNWINDVHHDVSGRIWVSTRSKVLAYIDDNKVVKFPLILGAGTGYPGPVTVDNRGGLWIGSAGNGVFFIREDSIMNMTMREGLLSDYCYSMEYDGRYIWAVHKSGLSRINPHTLIVKAVPYFENNENIQFNLNSIASARNGRIFLGSNRGVVVHDPMAEFPLEVPPLLNFISVKVNDVEIKPFDGIVRLKPGMYKVKIDYLGSSLRDPQLVTYQYMLEGLMDGWSEITGVRSVTFPGLTTGNYSFIIKSSNADEVVTPEPARLDILIMKPLWRHWWFFPAVVALCVVFVYYYIKLRERKLRIEKKILEAKVKERTHELELRKNEIEQQRDEINEKNLNITSSIRYARQIQTALLPPSEVLFRALPDSFVLHMPRDIVSGDFYWLAERDNKIIFTVADCTGHGVPGAFMSLLGITLLNEIVNVDGITRSDEIITELRKRVVHCLQQHRKESATLDGMELSMCVLDKRGGKIEFTGAMNDIVRVRKGKLEVIPADKLDVSVSYNNPVNFTRKELDFCPGDMLYLFSDGYQDQFGGEFDKKFLRPHFYTTLIEVHKHPVMNQKEILEKKIVQWMSQRPQTDDITILGVRF